MRRNSGLRGLGATEIQLLHADGKVTPVDVTAQTLDSIGRFNPSRLPAITVPCGFAAGLPVGLQMVGPRHGDQRVLQFANVFGKNRAWRGAGEGLGEVPAACNDVWMGGACGETSTRQRAD